MNSNIFEAIDRIKEDTRREVVEQICEYVRTDEFKASWAKAKGVTFGDFMAELLKNKFE